MPGFKYPVLPKEDGSGFNILLKPTLTEEAVAADEGMPPDMAGGPDLQEDRATRETQAPDWMTAVGDAAATSGVNVPTGGARAPYTPPDMGGNGLLSKLMPGGMGDTLSAVAGGMNTIERTQTPMAGFAAGFSGAMSARDTRRKDKRLEMLQDEERQWRKDERLYQRGRDVKEDERADRRETRLNKAADINDMSALIGLDSAQRTLQKAKADDLADRFGMSAAEQADANKNVADNLKILGKDFVLDPQDDEETIKRKTDAFMALEDQLRAREYAKYEGRNAPGVREALQTPNSPAQTPSQVDPSKPGASAASAISWTPGAEPQNDGEYVAQLEAAVAANGGNPIYVKNPRTGVVGLYVSRR